MDDSRPYTSSTDQFDNHVSFRPRTVPDVPEDVDFLLEHLNDPNYDLKKNHPPSFESLEKGGKKFYASEIDTESHFESDRYSTSRAESRNSTAIDFDECVISFFLILSSNAHSLSVSLLIQKFALQYLASMTH